jgi:nitrogen fixation protein FixH
MARPRQPGWWYPWIFVGGMLVVIAVNGVLATLAVATWPGLATDEYYRKGLEYNRTLAAAREQGRRGWRMGLAFAPVEATDGRRLGDLTVNFVGKDGRPLQNLDVEAQLLRPTHEGFDVEVDLDHRGGGVYGAMVSLPLPGQWDAHIHAHRGGANFQESRRLSVP